MSAPGRVLGAILALMICVAGGTTVLAQDKDDDDDKSPSKAAGAPVTLTTQQRDSAGITVAHPTAIRLAQQELAFGQVLDPSTLVSEFGQVEAALASQKAADADLERLQGLYHAEAASSLKMVQAAQSEQIRARAQFQSATSIFTTHWGALARLPAEQRDQMIQHAASGSHLLVRASILGRRSIAVVPTSASLDVDGLRVPARIVGILASTSDVQSLQSAGLLLEVTAAPQGLGPGTHVPVTLSSPARSGAWVPDDALIYGEHGAGLFKQVGMSPTNEKWQYAQVPVELLQKQARGWLVKGVSKDDLVVVSGVGSLWSLQSDNAAADDDDND